MKKLILFVVLTASAVACHHRGPTSPDPSGPVGAPVVTGDPQPPVPPTPEPEPPVVVPTPAPVPPPPPVEEPEEEPEPQAPAPVPQPAPQPAPAPAPQQDVYTYTATTSSYHWLNGAVLPASFEVRIHWPTQTMWFGPLAQLKFAAQDREHVFFNGPDHVAITIQGNRWTYAGNNGRADGVLVRR